MAQLQRISIGFEFSPPVAMRVRQEELDRLTSALGGEGWHEVVGDDGTLRLSLRHVLWVRVEKNEQRVGFGLSTE
jgi:hypothetical protein